MNRSQDEISSSREPGYTSQHTRRIVLEAESALGDLLGSENLDAEFESLAAAADQLGESELQRLRRFASLLEGDPDSERRLRALSRDGTFEVQSLERDMVLAITIFPPVAKGCPVTGQAILGYLAGRSISQGVLSEAIERAVESAANGETARDVVIVRGEFPQAGRPERLLLFARRSPDADPEQFVMGADATEQRGPWICRANDVIFRRVPAGAGKPGYNALGDVLPPPQDTPAAIEVGPNVCQHGNDYVATASGVVLFEHGRLEVRRMLVVGEEVTRQMGPLEFDGDVHTLVGVGRGAVIKATGNIRVDGPVEAATIESSGGDVELRHGVAGQRLAVIRAAGDITVRFSENATLCAGRNIIVRAGSLHSRLIACRGIFVTQGRGQLIGGSAVAGEFVEARQIGSSSGVATELMVGLGEESMQELGELDGRIAAIEARHDQAKELADRIERAIGDPAKLKQEERKAYTMLRKVEFVAGYQADQLRERRKQLLIDGAASHGGHVSVLEQLNSNVVIRIGKAVLDTKECERRCRVAYNSEQERVEITSLR